MTSKPSQGQRDKEELTRSRDLGRRGTVPKKGVASTKAWRGRNIPECGHLSLDLGPGGQPGRGGERSREGPGSEGLCQGLRRSDFTLTAMSRSTTKWFLSRD